MARDREAFAGGDQRYLREEQYRDSTQLGRRMRLHERWSTSPVSFHAWVAERFELIAGAAVVEVGCGPGWLWEHAHGAAHVPPGVRVTLVDLSAGMVDEAVARARAMAVFAHVEGVAADAQALPLPDACADRVIANHMLYHLPDPARGVAELARIVHADGVVVVATNGRHHMRELWELRAQVFGTDLRDATLDVFGAETGFPLLRDRFATVEWHQFDDTIRCADRDDVLGYVCSTPPAESATPDELARLGELVDGAMQRGGGVMTITKDSGCFVCRTPRR